MQQFKVKVEEIQKINLQEKSKLDVLLADQQKELQVLSINISVSGLKMRERGL
jgi:hypothetical protein